MIICDLDTIGISIDPDKAHSPLVVDPDAMLTLTVAFQRFETIGGRHPQIFQSARVVEHTQLAPGNFLDIPG